MIERARAALTGRHAWLWALIAGALQSLAFAPAEASPLAILCLSLLFWQVSELAPGKAARSGFAFGVGLFLAGTYWLYISIHVFGQAPAALALFLMLALVAIMGGYLALFGALLARVPVRGRLGYFTLALPAGWVLIEWARGWILSGFPWLALGYSQIDTPLIGYAPVLGVYGVSLAAAVSAGALVALLATPGRRRAIPLLIAGLVWMGGFGLERQSYTKPVGAPLKVAIVQGAISQDLKWQEDNRLRTLEIYRTLNDQAWGARLIVWPEAALPVLYQEIGPYLAALEADAERHDADILMGLLRYEASGGEYFNGLYALKSDEWYYKRRLVPFGEFFPVPSFVREWMRLQSLAYVDMTPGNRIQAPLDAAGQKLAATICYEDAYAAEQLATLDRATLLVNVSNDAWFGNSTAPHQHLEITRMRAIEAGRAMVRATNNGISALIAPNGRVMARAPQFVPVVLKGEVQPYTGLTPFARYGNVPVVTLSILALVGTLVPGLCSMVRASRQDHAGAAR